MPRHTLALILAIVIAAAALTVWLVTAASGGQIPLVAVVVALGAAFVLRIALRKRPQ